MADGWMCCGRGECVGCVVGGESVWDVLWDGRVCGDWMRDWKIYHFLRLILGVSVS